MNGTWFTLLWGLFAIVIGSINAFAPQFALRMNRRASAWQYRNRQAPEPSAAAMMFGRAIGGVFVIAGVCAIVYFFAHLPG